MSTFLQQSCDDSSSSHSMGEALFYQFLFSTSWLTWFHPSSTNQASDVSEASLHPRDAAKCQEDELWMISSFHSLHGLNICSPTLQISISIYIIFDSSIVKLTIKLKTLPNSVENCFWVGASECFSTFRIFKITPEVARPQKCKYHFWPILYFVDQCKRHFFRNGFASQECVHINV